MRSLVPFSFSKTPLYREVRTSEESAELEEELGVRFLGQKEDESLQYVMTCTYLRMKYQ